MKKTMALMAAALATTVPLMAAEPAGVRGVAGGGA